MKYLCLVYLSAEKWNACPDSACAAYAGLLQDNGKLIDGKPLHPVHTATTVRVRNGQTNITDGPFAETKEVFGGFYLLEADDLDAALELAARIPATRLGGSVEVRPMAGP